MIKKDADVKIKSTRTKKSKKNNNLDDLSINSPALSQYDLFHVETQIEYENIEMGVLENGIAYLSESGLARMCGIDRKTLYELSSDWANQRIKPRGKVIEQLLKISGYNSDVLFVKAEYKGIEVNAYTEPVSMALLEYYAFESNDIKEQAVRAYRVLAKFGLRKFVYDATGYSPQHNALDSWKHFHDRTDLTMDATPFGYFGVFREIAIMIVPMIRIGVIISDKVVPDISVGKIWSQHWVKNNLSEKYGERIKYSHEYPDYYPQSKSNPQPSYAYPNEALGEFRAWLQKNYITTKLPNYLLRQINKGDMDVNAANKVLSAFGENSLPQQKPKELN